MSLPKVYINYVQLSPGLKQTKKNMKKVLILITSVGLGIAGLFLIACGSNLTNNSTKNGVTNSETPVIADPSKPFTLEFKSQPAEITAGTSTDLIFTIKDKQGATVKDLQIVHEKPMHLIVVSSDLAEFYHIHPEPQPDGSLRVSYSFPNGGDYKLYADFTPAGSTQVVEQIELKVAGTQRAKIALVPDPKFEKTVDGLKVIMKPSASLKAGKELRLDFQMFDAASGMRAPDLQNYLGELAHFVLISQDLKDYVHVHPMSKGQSMDSMNMGEGKMDDQGSGDDHSKMEIRTSEDRSEVSAHTAFPRAGLYKIWAQFQRGGKVIAVPFIVKVGEADIKKAKSQFNAPAGAIKVMVSKNGFEPAEIRVEKGKPTQLAFYRTDAENCANEVVFPKLNINKKLPVGETVLVEFTPHEAGDISFACGMNMLKGKVVVN